VNATHLRNAATIVVVILVGSALKSVESLAVIDVWRWALGDLITWSSFTVAAVAAAVMAEQVAVAGPRPVFGTPALARVASIALVGLALWLLLVAAKAVLEASWRPAAEKVFAFALVGLAGYLVWVIHSRFEQIASALARARPAATGSGPGGGGAASAAPTLPSPGAAPGGFCVHCGAAMPAGNRFCGACGNPR
jgi:hypothetical protein